MTVASTSPTQELSTVTHTQPVALGRSLALDALRGIAVLLVIGRHISLPNPGGAVGVVAEAWTRAGWVGVDLFFVLSGFLISGLLFAEHRRRGRIDVGRFLARRGWKIYPPYLVLLAYLAWRYSATHDDTAATFWPYLVFVNNYVGEGHIGHAWTLAVEEHFYITLPLVMVALLAVGRLRAVVPMAVAALAVCLLMRVHSVWSGDPWHATMARTHFRFDALLVGVALRGVAEFYPSAMDVMGRRPVVLMAFGLAMWCPCLFMPLESPWMLTAGLTGTSLGAACLLVGATKLRLPFGGVVPRLLAGVGFFSYSIYLWHVTALRISEREVSGLVEGVASPSVQWCLTVGAGVVACVGVGVGMYWAVERPCLALRERLFPSRTPQH